MQTEKLSHLSPFFYIIRHLPSNKLYVGCKYSETSTRNSKTFMTENGYPTSSDYVKQLIVKDGLKSFKIERIRHFETSDDVLDYEARFLHRVNAKSKPHLYINKHNGGANFRSMPHTTESRKKISEGVKGMVEWNDGSKTIRARKCPGTEWVRGHHDPTQISKRNSKANKGLFWWTNGIENIRSAECHEHSYRRGRTISKDNLKLFSDDRVGLRLWNDGVKSTWSKKSPGLNWSLGPHKSKEKTKNRIDSHQGLKWWTKDNQITRAKECPGEGWVNGRGVQA